MSASIGQVPEEFKKVQSYLSVDRDVTIKIPAKELINIPHKYLVQILKHDPNFVFYDEGGW